jgi:putative addiction module component (TIGR02574 family)
LADEPAELPSGADRRSRCSLRPLTAAFGSRGDSDAAIRLRPLALEGGSGRRDRLPSMAKLARDLKSQALKLPRRQRARLAQQLISSLDEEVDPDPEKLWLAEAERRLAEIQSGKVASIPADTVMKKARASLR